MVKLHPDRAGSFSSGERVAEIPEESIWVSGRIEGESSKIGQKGTQADFISLPEGRRRIDPSLTKGKG